MPHKIYNSNSSKSSSGRLTNSRASSASVKPRVANPRRVLPSRKVVQSSTTERMASLSGVISDNQKPKKTTKSDFHVRKQAEHNNIDYCKKCGDVVSKKSLTTNTDSKDSVTSNIRSVTNKASKLNIDIKSAALINKCLNSDKSTTSINKYRNTKSSTSMNKCPRMDTKSSTSINKSLNIDTKSATSINKCPTKKKSGVKINGKVPVSLQQYYKNENYLSTDSVEDINNDGKKISLDTIKEVSEIHPSDSIFKIYPDSDEDITFLDTDDHESLKRLKEFREKNYFECHSAKSRVRKRGSATSLQDHKCVYRFYLNDRLFPVPLSTDHNNQVRCVECHLPMELNVDDSSSINGTIQAKVTIGKKNQDIMLLLPVKEPLIITEKRKEEKPKDNEVLFFGVINLDGFGNSLFNSTLPSNSFALKYQKGYKEFESKEEYSYRDLDKADVIVL